MNHLKLSVMYLALCAAGCAPAGDDLAGVEGTGDTASAYGTVTGFGSIYVNGIHFDTTGAAIEIDGEPALEADLAIGMVVEVRGTYDETLKQGDALTVRADRLLLGTITDLNPYDWSRKSIDLLGQRVYVSEQAAFSNTEFASLSEGDAVSISGYIGSDGLIHASFIRHEQPHNGRIEIEGYITELNTTSQTFAIRNQTVRYAEAEFVQGLASHLAAGARVEVRGQLLENNTLQAASVQFKQRSIISPASLATIEGMVRERVSDTLLRVNDTLIDITQAQLEPAGTIEVGMHVIARGRLVGAQMLAERMVVKAQQHDLIKGTISDINPDELTFTVLDTIYQVNEFTSFEDQSQQSERYFDFTDLQVGDDLELFVFNRDERWQVSRIIRTDGSDWQHLLSGKVDSRPSATTITVQGVLVDASAIDDYTLNDIVPGVYVRIAGQPTGMLSFKAQRVELVVEITCSADVFYSCTKELTTNEFSSKRKK